MLRLGFSHSGKKKERLETLLSKSLGLYANPKALKLSGRFSRVKVPHIKVLKALGSKPCKF